MNGPAAAKSASWAHSIGSAGAVACTCPTLRCSHSPRFRAQRKRTQIVRSSEGYQLQVEANNWWGEPFGPMIGRLLVEELSQRLPGTTVFGETGAIAAEGDATVEINIPRLDADSAGAVLLPAQVAVIWNKLHGPVSTRAVRFTVPPQRRPYGRAWRDEHRTRSTGRHHRGDVARVNNRE